MAQLDDDPSFRAKNPANTSEKSYMISMSNLGSGDKRPNFSQKTKNESEDTQVVNDYPSDDDEVERVLEFKETPRQNINTIKEVDEEHSNPTLSTVQSNLEESKDRTAQFEPVHSNPYAQSNDSEAPNFPGEQLNDIANNEVLNKLHQSSREGAIDHNDSILFNHALKSGLLEDEKINDIFVGEPIEQGGIIKFKVKGFDSQGTYEIVRSMKDFGALRKTFLERLPGLYIPNLPKKKFFGDDTDKNVKFLEERCFHLEQFLKKLSRLPYLLQSGEFLVFTRPDQDKKTKEGRVMSVV